MVYDQEGSWLADLYDADYEALRTPSGDVDFYVEEARNAGGPVVEFGCGTGRVLVPTAEAGVEITGVDSSRDMLDKARENLNGRGVTAELRLGDMLEHVVGKKFSLVTIPFRSLAHIIETEDHIRLFRNMRRHLAPGGRLVFDHFQFNPKFLGSSGQERLEMDREEDGRRIRRYGTSRPDLSTQVSDIFLRWEIEDAEGRIERRECRFRMRWFYRFEVEHLLARCGLGIETIYGNFDRSGFERESPEMIFVATET